MPGQTVIERVLGPCEVIDQRQADADVRLQQLPRPHARIPTSWRRRATRCSSTAPARPDRGRRTARCRSTKRSSASSPTGSASATPSSSAPAIRPTCRSSAACAAPDDVILIDRDSHASIYDATRQTASQVDRLPSQLAGEPAQEARAPAGRSAQPAGRRRRAVFDSRRRRAAARDRRRLPRARRVSARRRSALARHVRTDRSRLRRRRRASSTEVDFIVGTFSKSLAGIGGVCVSDHAELRALHFLARAYVFTASGSPANVASVRAAIAVIRAHPELRDRLWANIRRLRAGLAGAWATRSATTESPIVPILTGEEQRTIALWQELLERRAVREPDRAARLPAR